MMAQYVEYERRRIDMVEYTWSLICVAVVYHFKYTRSETSMALTGYVRSQVGLNKYVSSHVHCKLMAMEILVERYFVSL